MRPGKSPGESLATNPPRMAELGSCIFCRILAGRAAGSFVFRDQRVAAFMAVPQGGRGHVLIVPVEHFENAYDLPADLAGPIFGLALRVARAIKRGLRPDGVTMAQNSEAGANQTVMHFHLHVVGRTTGQRLSLHDPAGQSDRGELDRVADVIRRALEEED
jgi:histidine triad (HIT) family protein